MAERLTWQFSAILLQLQRPKDLSNTSLVSLSVKRLFIPIVYVLTDSDKKRMSAFQ